MAGEDQKVSAKPRDIDRHVRHGLAGIDDHKGPNSAGSGHVRRQVVVRSQHVGHVSQRHNPGFRADHRLRRLQITVVGDVDPPQARSGAPRQLLPGHQVGVMLHHGYHDLVADAEVQPGGHLRVCAVDRTGSASVAQRIRHEIDRLGAVLGEDDLVGLTTDKRSNRGPSRLKRFGRFFGELMCPSVHRRVVLGVELALRVQHH